MDMSILSVCVSVHCELAQFLWRPEEGDKFFATELKAVLSCPVGAGNCIRVLCRGKRFSDLLSHLFSHKRWGFFF